MTIQYLIASAGFALLLVYVVTTAVRSIKAAVAEQPAVTPPVSVQAR